MKILNVQQGSAEWLAARCAKHRASRTADMLAKTKSGWGASRANYKSELVCENLTNQIAPSFTSEAMQRGIDLEAKARSAFALVQNCDVQQIGLVVHAKNEHFVASPDGWIPDEKALLEIKCPNTNTHIEYLLSKEVPSKYNLQIQSQLACSGADYAYFVSYDDRLPDLSLFIKKVERDNKLIAEIEEQTEEFLEEVADTVAQLKKLKEAA